MPKEGNEGFITLRPLFRNMAPETAANDSVELREAGEFTILRINGEEDVALDHSTGRVLVHADGGEEPTHNIDIPSLQGNAEVSPNYGTLGGK